MTNRFAMGGKCCGTPSAKFAMIQFTAWDCHCRAMLLHFFFDVLEPL